MPTVSRPLFDVHTTLVSYFAGVRRFATVRYPGAYEGIDLVYHGSNGALEYDFEVSPGADPSAIALRFEGAESLRVDREGSLS